MRSFGKTKLAAVILLALGCLFSANAQRPLPRGGGRWELLGRSRVDGLVDHDRITVRGGPYRAIQSQVAGSAIDFQRVVVRFANGSDFPVEMRNRIAAGGRTRAIDLPGDRRNIRDVEFWYSRGGWGRHRPTVHLYGMR